MILMRLMAATAGGWISTSNLLNFEIHFKAQQKLCLIKTGLKEITRLSTASSPQGYKK